MRGRLRFVVAAAAAAALLTGSAAQSATPSKRYFRFTADAVFKYTIDYGDHPESTYNGTFEAAGSVSIRAIAVYDGRTVTIPRQSMVSASEFVVDDDRTLWSPRSQPRRPIPCANAEQRRGFAFTSGYLSISNAGLRIDPGSAVSIPCTATESLVHHGMQSGPHFVVPAPARARFRGTSPFSVICEDVFAHGPEGGSGGINLHTFRGFTFFYVRFTPFRQAALAATKKQLRQMVGKAASSGSYDGASSSCD